MISKVSPRFLRHNKLEDNDDVICIGEAEGGMFTLVFRPADLKRTRFEAVMTRRDILEYISDILKSMPHDIDPFDRIQLLTDMHPSVMYDVIDLDDNRVRYLIEDAVDMSLRTAVSRVVTRRA